MSDRVQDENLKHVVQLSKRMLEAAETGDMGRDDAGCGIVFGALRDAAYKLRKLATAELTRHKVDAGESEEPVAPAGCPLNRNCRPCGSDKGLNPLGSDPDKGLKPLASMNNDKSENND